MMKRLTLLLTTAALLAGCAMEGYIGGIDMGMVSTAVKATAKASRPISDEEEYYVGRAVSARILAAYPLSEDKRLTDYVNLVGRTMAFHSDKPYTHGGYHFAVLDSSEINAFAAPGGMIFITKGMVQSAGNEDELAAILAHEVAHINHRDGIASIKEARWTEALTVIGTEAAKRYGSRDLARLVGIFENSIDDVFKTLVVNGYSKAQEKKADEEALRYLSRAGYAPSSLLAYLNGLEQRGAPKGGGILKTHPPVSARVSLVEANLPAGGGESSFLQARTERFNSYLP